MNLVSLTLVLVLLTAQGCLALVLPCQDPENVTAIRSDLTMKIQDHYHHEISLYSDPVYLRKAYEHLHSQNQNLHLNSSTNEKRVVVVQIIDGQPKCNKAMKKADTVCPSYTVLEYDSDRIPTSMVKARCSCDKCLQPHVSEACVTCKGRKRCRECWVESRCEAVYSYFPVIRRSCVNRLYQYYIDIESVAVGCTCRTRDNLD